MYVYTTCLLHYSRHGIFLQMPGWHDFSETTKTYFPVVSWMRCSLSFVTLHSTIVLFLPPPSSERCGNSPHNLVSSNPVHTTPCASTVISCPLHNVTKNLLADLVNRTQSAMLNPAGIKAPRYSLATEPVTCNIIQDKYSFDHAAAQQACRVTTPLPCTYKYETRGWVDLVSSALLPKWYLICLAK